MTLIGANMHTTSTEPLQSEVSSYATVISIQRYLATGTAKGITCSHLHTITCNIEVHPNENGCTPHVNSVTLFLLPVFVTSSTQIKMESLGDYMQ